MPEQITAAVLNSTPGSLELETLTLDDPSPDEIMVDIHYSGLCRSDLHEIEGVWPASCPTVLGHEASGIVRRVGERVRTLKPGDHVVTCLSAYCGTCRFCLAGRLTLCTRRTSLGTRTRPVLTNTRGQSVHPTAHLGAFAEAMVVHEHSAVRIPDHMPLAAASILGCAVVTGLSSVFRSAKVTPGSTVAVVGCGGIGIAAIQGARLAGAREIIAIDAVEARLTDALAFGATMTVQAGAVDPVAAVREMTDGGVDFSFEAVGLAATVQQSFAMLGPGGTATVVGLVPDSQPVSIRASELFMQEKRLQGALMGSNQFPTDIPAYARYYEQGRLNLDDMLSTILPLDQVNKGFELMRTAGGTRVVLQMRGTA